MFRNYDDDGNRQLSLEEFEKGLRNYGIALSPEETKALFNLFDRDGSGSINFDEMLEGVRVRLFPSLCCVYEIMKFESCTCIGNIIFSLL